MYFIVCCGDNHVFTVEQLSDSSLIPANYVLPGAAFNIFFEDESSEFVFGAKQIVSICLICLVVIGVVVGCTYYCKKKRSDKLQKNIKLAPSYRKTIEINAVQKVPQPAAIATPQAGAKITTPDTKFIEDGGVNVD